MATNNRMREAPTSLATLLTEDETGESVVISDPGLPDNPIVFVTPEFERQTGYSPAEALGRNCKFLQGAETDENAVNAIRFAIAAQARIEIDIVNYRKTGEKFLNRLRIRPIYDGDGNLMFFAGVQNRVL
jgi:PAS domain S-box-containing protein